MWNRIRATVLGQPVEVPQAAGSGRGVALLAAATVQHRGLGEVFRAWAGRSTVVEPDRTEAARLEETYQRFLHHLHSTDTGAVAVPNL